LFLGQAGSTGLASSLQYPPLQISSSLQPTFGLLHSTHLPDREYGLSSGQTVTEGVVGVGVGVGVVVLGGVEVGVLIHSPLSHV